MAAAALSGAIAGLVYSLRRSSGRFAWDGVFCGDVVRSSLPVVPMALAQMALLSLDYAFVSLFQGPAALATYGLAYTFASPVMLALAVINFTLLPEYVARHRRGDAAFVSFVESILAWGWAGGLATVAAAAALGPAVIELVAGRAYRAAGDLLPAIAAAYVLFTLAQALHLVRTALFANVRRTAAVAVACAFFNAAVNLWAVPRYGIRGAAATTLLSFLLYYLGMTTGLGSLFARSAWALAWAPLLALSAGPLALLLEPSAAARTLSALALMATALFVARRPRRSPTPSPP
jgi:O-antigen/teichoic acid export membrane protein